MCLLSINTSERNTRKGEELFKLRASVGTRTSGYKLAISKVRFEMKCRFLTIREVKFWNSLLRGSEGAKSLTCFKTELDQFYGGDSIRFPTVAYTICVY